MIRRTALIVTSLLVSLGMLLYFPGDLQSFADTPSEIPANENGSVTDNSYIKQSLSEIYSGGGLTLPAGVSEKDVTVNDNGSLTLKCTQDQYSSGKFTIAEKFDFDSAPVGRISVDGLADRKLKVSFSIFLDNEETPAAVFSLRNQMGKKAWTLDGDQTKDVLDKKITGKHTVSFSIDVTNSEPEKKYEIQLRSLEFVESSLPVLYFDIDESLTTINQMNSDEDHSTECYGSVTVQVPDGYVSEYSDEVFKTETYDLDYIRGRGNSTWWADKKPYKVKLDKSSDLFGMGKNKHWILLANRYDNSLLRNKITYWLGDQLNMPFTPQLVPVDVVMNGVYYGSYFLCEQIRIGKSRVAIDDLEDTPDVVTEPEITGGYLISMGSEDDEKGGNDISTNHATFLLEKPSFEDYQNPVQLNYIKQYMQKTENAVFGSGYKDKNGISYSSYMDVDAAIDYFWIQMFTKNGDAYGSNSTYLYKTRDSAAGAADGKLYWGPLWDFDYVAWGDLEYDHYFVSGFDTNMDWLDRLLKNRSFAKKFVARWPAIREQLQIITMDGGQLDKYYEQMIVSQRYDNEKHGYYEENNYEYVIGDMKPLGGVSPVSERTYKSEIDQLKGWINKRIDWVNRHVDNLIPKTYTVKFKANGMVLKTRKVTGGTRIGALPKAPAKKGYVFKGWYHNNKPVKAGTIVRQNMTVYAEYIKKAKYKPARKLYFLYNRDALYCNFDNYYRMPYSIVPFSSNAAVKWSSSNNSVASVSSSGLVEAKKPGKVKITGKINKKIKRSYTLYIFGDDKVMPNFKRVKLNRSFLKIKKGNYGKLTPHMYPVNCQHENGRFISMDKKIATVTKAGVVKGKKKGTTYILYYMPESNKYARCKVKITK